MPQDQLRLDDLVASVARRWRLIVAVAVPFFAGVLLYAASLPTTYTASATVAFSPKGDRIVGADTLTLLVPTYVAYIHAPETLERVGADHGVTATTLDETVDLTIPPTTATILIAVHGEDPDRLSGIANDLAAEAVKASKTSINVSAEVVSSAVPPTIPSGPRRKLLDLGGLIGAVLLGALVAMVVERGFPRVRNANDVGDALRLPLLGRLPRAGVLKHLGGEALDDELVGVAVRSLRNQLSATGQARVVVICSPEAGAGRSTLAVLLGHAYARLDKRVLMIDADPTNHALTSEYVLDLSEDEIATHDLASVLRGTAPLDQALHETGVPGLSVLPTALAPTGIADLIASKMQGLLGRLDHDIVVIDAPPLLVRDEAAALAALADAVVLVVASGTRTGTVRRALGTLKAAGGTVTGVVLNRVSPRSLSAGGPT